MDEIEKTVNGYIKGVQSGKILTCRGGEEMENDIEKRLCSGIKTLDSLRFKAAGSRTGCITVSIEELNAVREEIEETQGVKGRG